MSGGKSMLVVMRRGIMLLLLGLLAQQVILFASLQLDLALLPCLPPLLLPRTLHLQSLASKHLHT